MDNSSTITAKQAVQFIQSRTMVQGPGKYNLQVINEPTAFEGRLIVNLKAQTPSGLAKAKEHLRNNEYSEAANTNLSTSVFADAAYIPAKGDHVSCMVDYVEARDGSQVLGVVSLSEIKARSASKVSLGDEFANLLDEEVVAETETPELG